MIEGQCPLPHLIRSSGVMSGLSLYYQHTYSYHISTPEVPYLPFLLFIYHGSPIIHTDIYIYVLCVH